MLADNVKTQFDRESFFETRGIYDCDIPVRHVDDILGTLSN